MEHLTGKKAGGNTQAGAFPSGFRVCCYNIMKDKILYKNEAKLEIYLILGEVALIYDG